MTYGALMALDWDDLAAMALGRQFPPTDLPVAELMRRTGPIQSQTARSTFVGLAARSTAASHAAITAAFESGELVRGSSIRGTVHTATPTQQRSLDAASRIGLRSYWERTARLRHHDAPEAWAALEDFADLQWRTPEELRDHLGLWLSAHGEDAELAPHTGRHLPCSIGLVRRPANGVWDGQGAPEYCSAAHVTGLPLPSASEGVDAAVLLHVHSHGPSSREDLSWWSGLPVRLIDQSLSRMAADLITDSGPLDREYIDVVAAPAPRDLPGVRLLPEFDALLCGYHSKARNRFVSKNQHSMLHNSANGLLVPPLLVDGRICGWWRSTGSKKSRPLSITLFRSARRPGSSELQEAIGRLEASLDIRISEVSLDRASDG